MATFAELIFKAATRGVVSTITETLPVVSTQALRIAVGDPKDSAASKVSAPGADDPEELQKLLLEVLARIQQIGPALGQNPIFLGVISALLAPLVLGPIAQILNERTILRPMRDKIRPETLQAIDVIGAWRRGNFSILERDKRLGEIGFPVEDQAALIRLSEAIPGAQDIIRFAVREVYNPEQRAALDLDAEIAPVLEAGAEDMQIAGLPQDTFRKFWAAHWVLPSIQQAFEMRHRSVIDDKGLNGILKALDIAPIWRGRLESIAFTPFTRVDIRRMHKLGVLDDAAVVRAYKDIGYNDENAALQLVFVKALNNDPTQEDETFSDREAIRARDLTRTDIIRAFEEGVIEERDTRTALSGLGFAPGEIDHLVARAELATAVDNSRKAVKNLQNGFVKGALSEEFVRSFMGRLGLPASFIDDSVASWTLEVESNVALPTKAEILRWFSKELITEDDATDALTRMGFAPKWIKIMLEERDPMPEEET